MIKFTSVTDTLDYETSTAHTLTITVSDTGSPAHSSTVTVFISVNNVNEGGPTFAAYSDVLIDEDVGLQQSVARKLFNELFLYLSKTRLITSISSAY